MRPTITHKPFAWLALVAFTMITMILFWPKEDNAIDSPPVISVAWSKKNVSAIGDYEARLRTSPNDLTSRVGLAQAYLWEAQTSLQEAFYLPKAQAQLNKVFAQEESHFQALALQASLHNTLHQFEQAREIAEALILREPTHAYVYGILVDALVELGEYEAAVARCDEMLALRPGIASYARAAYLRELHGDFEGAVEAMQLAAGAGVVGAIDRSWALYQLGQLYLGDNDLEKAEDVFKGILEETPYYAFAIGGMGKISLQRDQYAAAIQRFEEAYAFVPADEFLEGMIEAYAMTGDKVAEARIIGQLRESYQDADAMGENVRMEYADFLADLDLELDEALELATLEYKRRPNHLHALETYAWVLHKMGRSAEAVPYIEQAMRLNTGDAMVHFRAGHIYKGAGDAQQAGRHFESAVAANLHIESPSAAQEVRKKL